MGIKESLSKIADRLLSTLSGVIIGLTVLLWCSSGLGLLIETGSFPVEQYQFYASIVLLSCSFVLAALSLLLTSHPFYEYMVVIIIGSMTGASYVN